jgi:hypothetical protein
MLMVLGRPVLDLLSFAMLGVSSRSLRWVRCGAGAVSGVLASREMVRMYRRSLLFRQLGVERHAATVRASASPAVGRRHD